MTDEPGSSVRQRLPYLPIHKRPPLVLPGNARVAVWTIVNVENWSPTAAMPRTVLPPPMGQPLLPDVPNWAWHEYGMRAGFWRQHAALTRRGLPVTLAINGQVCLSYPRVAAAARDAGWEFMGHGYVQGPMHDPPHGRHHHPLHRCRAAILGKPRPDRDRGDIGPPAPQRHRICRRLGDR